MAHWPALRQRTLAMGLPISDEHPLFEVDTRNAHIASAAASALAPEQAPALHAAIYRAHWVDGRDIGDRDTLVELAASVGLDGERFRAALADPQHLAAVVADEDKARASGINAVPQIVMNGYLLPAGLLPPDALDDAVEQVMQREPRQL